MAIKIVTDSTCDLPEPVVRDLNISVIPLYINIGDKGYLDGVDITRADFYRGLPDFDVHPTTATPSLDTFKSVFDEAVNAGAKQIISIHISESLSATVKIAESAAHAYKRVPVHVVDSWQLSMGTGFQVELAAKMAKAGRSVKEILSALKDLAARTFVAAGLDTLEFLRRSGRMNVFLAGIGSLLQLKPILTMEHGQPDSEKVRTAKKAMDRMVEMLKARLPIERLALLHTHAAEKAELFRARIADLIPNEPIYSMDITPVIGAHLGPGAVGFAAISRGDRK